MSYAKSLNIAMDAPIPVLGIVVLSALTVDPGGAGMGRGVRIHGQGTGRCTGFMATKSFY